MPIRGKATSPECEIQYLECVKIPSHFVLQVIDEFRDQSPLCVSCGLRLVSESDPSNVKFGLDMLERFIRSVLQYSPVLFGLYHDYNKIIIIIINIIIMN